MTLTHNNNTKWLLMVILTVCIITPFSNDIFIPSFPAIAKALGNPNVQLIMSVFLGGLALSQIFYGPLLDRFGRKPVLLGGLILFVISSFFVAFANSFSVLLTGRFFQAIGVCSTIVAALAIVRDSFPKEYTIKVIAILFGIIGVCPAISPIIGSYLEVHFGWRASFIFLLALGIFYLALVTFCFRESMLEKNKEALTRKHMFGNFGKMLKHRQFLSYITTSLLSYSILFGYIAAMPFLLINKLNLSIIAFGWIFALNALAIVIMAFLAPKMTNKIGLPKTLLIGAVIITIGASILLLINLNGSSVWKIVAPMIVATLGVGTIRPTASAGAMNIFPPNIAGSAAALFSFFSFAGGAIFTVIAGKLAMYSTIEFASAILILGVLAIVTALRCQTKETA